MLTDRFTFSQLPSGFDGSCLVRPSSAAEARAILEAAGSAVGDKTLAKVLSTHLGVPVPANPQAPELHPEDQIVLVEYRGPKLTPGQAFLPEEGRFDFFLVEIGIPQAWMHKE